MSADEKRKRLAFAIAEFLEAQKSSFADEEKQESLGIAVDCINTAFGIDVADPAQKTLYSIQPVSLPSIFNVYLSRAEKKDVPAAAEAPKKEKHDEPTVTEPKDITSADKTKAEEKKQLGNKLVGEKDYQGAIKAYTEAIDFDDTNAVYFANRAAAYSQTGDHDMAVDDAKAAIKLDANYAKAYSRLGHALYCMERYSEAVAAYEKGTKLDPSNEAMKDQLQKAKEMAGPGAGSGTAPAAGGGLGSLASMLGGMGGAGGGMPDLSSMLGGLGRGGAGGMPDLGSIMSNPMFQQAAEMMRNNPGMLQNMMSNPMFQQMAGGMMGRGAGGAGAAGAGTGGGMPDMSSLLNNPDLMNAAANLFGGAGRGRGGADSNQ